MSLPLEVFCCYAHEDQKMLENLEKHLTSLQRQGQIIIWSATNLDAGMEWEKELNQHLESADIILLLISPGFIASDYCYNMAMERAIARYDEGSAQVIPILLRPTHWKNAPFAKLHVVPTNAKPVTNWPNRDDAFHNIVRDIDKVILKLKSSRQEKLNRGIYAKKQHDQTATQNHLVDNGKIPDEDVSPSTQETDKASSLRDRRGRVRERQRLRQLFRWFPSTSSLRLRISLACLPIIIILLFLLHPYGVFFVSTKGRVAPMSTSSSGAIPPANASDSDSIPPVYGVQGHIILDNPLLNQQTSGLWIISSKNSTIGCHIHNRGYDVIMLRSNYCLADSTSYLTNFVYQIEMTTVQEQPGQTAGILFHVNDGLGRYYSFQMSSVDGSYSLYRSNPTSSAPDFILASKSSRFIRTGNQQKNVLGVKVIGSSIDLYINSQLVQHVSDFTYTSGNIGVGILINDNTPSSKAEVIFHYAKVWAI